MKIASWNVNGIRAVERKKELQNFLKKYEPDVFLIQETKAKPEQLSKYLTKNNKYEQFYHSAKKAGYAGTSIWIKKNQTIFNKCSFKIGMPNFEDTEGRIIRLDFKNWSILNIYFPNGGKSPQAWQEKLKFYEKFLKYINELRRNGRYIIWAGDVNCAHKEIDLARPKENKNSIGFLPEERSWISKTIQNKWIDIFRTLNPNKIMYSWWHVITHARERNVGWRIDYFFIDEKFLKQIKNIKYINKQMGSDHCPIILKIDI